MQGRQRGRAATGGSPVRGATGATRIRAGLLLAATSVASAGVRSLVAPPLLRVVDHVVGGGSPVTLPLDDLLAGCLAAGLLGCWLWCVLAGLALGLSVLRHGQARPTALRRSPAPVRLVVLAALGATAVAAPAGAVPVGTDDRPATRASSRPFPGVAGLPLPDRVTTAPSTSDPTPAPEAAASTGPSPSRHVAPPGTIRVRPGDSLWHVAERLLPGDAAPAAVDRAWRALAEANASHLGPDPDLIFPGTVLRVPDLGTSLGKESS